MFPSCRLQFTAWVDAVIFVFSLENESSFKAIYNYYTQMAHFRNSAEIPLILVGTQAASLAQTLDCYDKIIKQLSELDQQKEPKR
uniref:Uncharacterized protein n=1 Tax=Timema bartmani TaxID=61472 RepID=A0A7R9EUA4_9NEOP|nr:unnamed protein product [Timema bartmani]